MRICNYFYIIPTYFQKHLVPEMAHGAIRMDKADILELTVSHLKALQDECANGKFSEENKK